MKTKQMNPADGAPAAAAAAKIEKQITSGWPPVKKKIGSGRPAARPSGWPAARPSGWPDTQRDGRKKKEKIKVCLKR